MVIIIKLRSELGCDNFTRKHNKISRNMKEEINCELAFRNSYEMEIRNWKYKLIYTTTSIQ